MAKLAGSLTFCPHYVYSRICHNIDAVKIALQTPFCHAFATLSRMMQGWQAMPLAVFAFDHSLFAYFRGDWP